MERDRVCGRNAVRALLESDGRRVDEIAVLAGAAGPLAEVVALARRAGVKVSFRTREQLTAIAGSPAHQGVVARVAASEYVGLDDLLRQAESQPEPIFLLALDQVQDPQNLGAVLRAAEAFGVHGVVVTKHHAVGLTAAVARTSAGALAYMAVAKETNLVTAMERLKKLGVWTYGGVTAGGLDPWRVDLTGPICLVLGSEGAGLRPLVARACDALITIPMAGRLGSLNVAAAAAVLCYEVARQRSRGEGQQNLDFEGRGQ